MTDQPDPFAANRHWRLTSWRRLAWPGSPWRRRYRRYRFWIRATGVEIVRRQHAAGRLQGGREHGEFPAGEAGR